MTKGTAYGYFGRGYEALAEIEGGLRLAERHGLAATALRARVNLGALLAPGDPREALEIARAGLAESQRLGHRRTGPGAPHQRGGGRGLDR